MARSRLGALLAKKNHRENSKAKKLQLSSVLVQIWNGLWSDVAQWEKTNYPSISIEKVDNRII